MLLKVSLHLPQAEHWLGGVDVPLDLLVLQVYALKLALSREEVQGHIVMSRRLLVCCCVH